MSNRHRTLHIMLQDYPVTTAPWWVSETIIDEDRERVTHRVVKGPFATRPEAVVALIQREESPLPSLCHGFDPDANQENKSG